MSSQIPAKASLPENGLYSPRMPRKLSKVRPAQGAHLLHLREQAGLTQAEVAELIGEPTVNISFWERSEKPPRSDVLPKMADALGVTVEDILKLQPGLPRRKGGPVGKLRRVFDDASRLPRGQQDKLVEAMSAMIHGLQGQRS